MPPPEPAKSFRVAAAQVEPTLGNIAANLAIHLDRIDAARGGGADLIVFPELSTTGYYLRDQVPEVAEPRDGRIVSAIREAAGGMAVVFGFVEEGRPGRFFNAGAFVDGGGLVHVHRKVYLPTYGMFDERRYFAAGDRVRAFDTRFGRVGLLVCEDAWHLSCGVILQADEVDLLILIGNSPGRGVESADLGSRTSWDLLIRTYASFLGVPVVFSNRVGYEDGVCFWGGSRVVDAGGRTLAEAPGLDPALVLATIDPKETRRQRLLNPMIRDEMHHITRDELGRIHRERNARDEGR